MKTVRQTVFDANMLLSRSGLVVLTWGNASQFDRDAGFVYIKPSGVEYARLTPEMIVQTNMSGAAPCGSLKPSSDLPTHLFLYGNYPGLNAVVHTHSPYATAFAQAGMPIPPLGTTHADTFCGEIPCTAPLTDAQIAGNYELETGRAITEALPDPEKMPAVLVFGHGVFCFGSDAEKAAENAITLEETAKLAWLTLSLRPNAPAIPKALSDRHFFRKHGKNAYYGQCGR